MQIAQACNDPPVIYEPSDSKVFTDKVVVRTSAFKAYRKALAKTAKK